MADELVNTEPRQLTEEEILWIQSFVGREDKVLLYGPGRLGKLCLANLQAAERNVVGFMGRNAKKHPVVEGLPCWLPDEIPAEQRGDYLVIISVCLAPAHYKGFVQNMKEKGFSRLIDCWFLTMNDDDTKGVAWPSSLKLREKRERMPCPLRAEEIDRLQPAFPGEDRCIVLLSSNEFVPVLSTMIQSIIECASPEHPYDIVVLHQAITKDNQAAVIGQGAGYENISIRFYNIGPLVKNAAFSTGWYCAYPAETYFRLFIPWVLSDDYRFAVYMDSDMIVRKDLFGIFDLDMGTNLIAAMRDYGVIWRAHIPGYQLAAYHRSMGIENSDDYVTAATVIFHLREFRKRYTIQQVWDLSLSADWVLVDQDVLNVLCQHSICYLSSTWGWVRDYGEKHYLPEAIYAEWSGAAGDPAVVHFAGSIKLWAADYGGFVDCGDYDEDFWRYASHTPFVSDLIGWIESPEYKTYVMQKLGLH